jgi:tetratricopeptide (TPR) repeat protein
LLHLGRAIADCPIARFPVERLVSLSLEVANVPTLDMSVTWAAVRALERALNDAPNRPELSEALGLLHLRVGRPREAERRMAAVIAASPGRGRPYALLSQSFRAQGKLDSAIEAVQAGKLASGDALLSLELGMVLAARGELDAAAIAFREVLSLEHCNCAAFCELAALALRTKDVGTAQWLIDTALSSSDAQAEVYRRAVELALQSEGEGLPRAARIARLCERLLGRVPNDPQGLHWLARALIDLGERGRARARLEQLARVAPNSGAAADAQLLRLSLDDPGADLELKSVLRAAHAAVGSNLGDVAARGRRLGDAHAAWTGFFAAAVAERRRGRFSAARRSLEAALEIAPGAGVVRYELVGVLLALQDANGAVSHAEALLALDWPRANALGLLARSLAAAGRDREAADAAQRALSIQPDDQETRALLIRLHRPPRTHWANRVMRLWTRFNES